MLKTLNKYVPIKTRYVRANEAPFMNKVLKKTITIKNVFFKKGQLKIKFLIVSKRTIVPASYGKKTILKILTF